VHRVRRTTICCRFFAPSVGLLLVVISASGGWTQAPATPAPSQSLPIVLQWFVAISAAPAVPPVASGDRVFIALRTGSVAAHRMSNGAPLWSVDLAAEQPLALDETHVFVASGEAVHAIDASSGVASWRAPTGAVTAPLLVHSGWLVAASGGGVTAFRAADGTRLWREELGVVDQRPFIDGESLFVPIADGRLLAIELQTGKRLWERRLKAPLGEPLAAHERVYVGSGDKHFNCLDAEDGEIEWRRRVGAEVRGRPAADEDRVYFAALDNELRAVDRGDGAITWHRGVPFRPSAGPIVLGTAVAIPGPAAELRMFEASSGAAAQGVRFIEPIVIAPAIMPAAELAQLRIAAVTGGLNNQWRLAVFGPPGEPPPPVPVVPLTVMPGVPLQLPM
jgi:outer membrane protein assembly factor BamB